MAEKYDVIVVGAGHNGLIVASYLAKAGVKVCVLEEQPEVGGGTKTKEMTIPGFKHDCCSSGHYMIFANPLMRNDELGLMSKYGLEYARSDKLTGEVFEDGTTLKFYLDIDKTCESIATISERDAEVYREFEATAGQAVDMIAMGMFGPPASAGTSHAMMDQSDEGRELLRAQAISAWDIAEEWFENDKLKISLSRFAAEAMNNPFDKGTGFGFFIILPFMHRFGGWMPVGGSGALAEALARCLEAQGGTIKLNSAVKAFKLSGDEVKGVVLAGGEEILADKAVVANINAKQIFPDMLSGIEMPPKFNRNIHKLHQSRYSGFIQHIALNDKPIFKAGGDLGDFLFVEFGHMDVEHYRNALYRMDLGYLDNEFSNFCMPTSIDPSRAPDGKAVVHNYALVPPILREGHWDEVAQATADTQLEIARRYCTNLTDDNILGRSHVTPLDVQRRNSAMPNGDICHFGMYNWQIGGNRPLPGWSQYRMPVKKLYMSGSSTHPGGGVTGGGRAAVQAIMEDMDIDFEKIIE